MVDTLALEASAVRHVSSSLTPRTIIKEIMELTESELRDSEEFKILKRAYKTQSRDDLILIILKYMLGILK